MYTPHAQCALTGHQFAVGAGLVGAGLVEAGLVGAGLEPAPTPSCAISRVMTTARCIWRHR